MNIRTYPKTYTKTTKHGEVKIYHHDQKYSIKTDHVKINNEMMQFIKGALQMKVPIQLISKDTSVSEYRIKQIKMAQLNKTKDFLIRCYRNFIIVVTNLG